VLVQASAVVGKGVGGFKPEGNVNVQCQHQAQVAA
jgi:hypothetical protein